MERRRLAILCSHLCSTGRPPLLCTLPPVLSASGCHASAGGGGRPEGNTEKERCVFCLIVRGESPAFKLYEDDVCLCILDSNPLSFGHSLIIPKLHFPSLQATPPSVKSNTSTLQTWSLEGRHFMRPNHLRRLSLILSATGATPTFSQVVAAMCSTVPFLTKAIMKATQCDSFNLLVNNGAAAGQVIFHTHLHVIPRRAGDQLWPSEGHRQPIKQNQETLRLVSRIRERISSPQPTACCSTLESQLHKNLHD